ncbi:MAG: MFS transporter [Balneolales bacterium]
MSAERNQKIFLIIAIAIIALNLRPAIAGVGPLIHEIRLDTGLSNTSLGVLTTLPLLALGVFSFLTPVFTRRLGTEGTMAFALFILTAGILCRVIPAFPALFLGTAILGIGIALGNVLLPGIAKKRFPHNFGLVTGIYSAMLGAGAAIASGVSVPLSEGLNLGWRWSLGFWAIVSFVALIAWLPQLKNNDTILPRKSLLESLKHLSASKMAWHVAFFMGLQSFTFYVLVAWLPEILIERGMSPTNAGFMLSFVHAVGAVGTFLMPSWASQLKNQRLPVVVIVVCEFISIAALMLPSIPAVTFWMFLLGISSGSSFGVALLFIGLRSRDSDSANELSGMSQSVGYTLAATGPALFGALHDLAQTWTLPLGFLLLITLLKLWSGWGAGKDEFI